MYYKYHIGTRKYKNKTENPAHRMLFILNENLLKPMTLITPIIIKNKLKNQFGLTARFKFSQEVSSCVQLFEVDFQVVYFLSSCSIHFQVVYLFSSCVFIFKQSIYFQVFLFSICSIYLQVVYLFSSCLFIFKFSIHFQVVHFYKVLTSCYNILRVKIKTW